MIINTYDDKSPAKINPEYTENSVEVDICIFTFSYMIEEYVLKNFKCKKIGEAKHVSDIRDVYVIDYKGKKIGFSKILVGAPACVSGIERTFSVMKSKRYILFGGAGCLNKEIAHGKIMVPTEAYRDEGTSYHYMKPSDYVEVKNHKVVSEFMEKNSIPYVEGKVWTTDAIYRETLNNFEKRKSDGCICVDMECSAVQAMCDFRYLDFYTFFTSGDLLDAPKWHKRTAKGTVTGSQHDSTHFDIAIELANYIVENNK